MAQEPQHIDFDRFAANLSEVLTQISDQNRPVLVDRDGETFRVEKEAAQDIWKDYDPERVQQALSASRGMFAVTSTEEFLREIDEQREQGPNRLD